MRLAVGLSSQFIQPSMAQYILNFHCVPVRERPRAPCCGGGSVSPRPVASPWAGPGPFRPGGVPAIRSARCRRRLPPSGGGAVFLAAGAPPSSTVRMRLRVPPSAVTRVPPSCLSPGPPLPCMVGTVIRGRPRVPPVGGFHVVSPRPRGLPGVPHRPGPAPRVPPCYMLRRPRRNRPSGGGPVSPAPGAAPCSPARGPLTTSGEGPDYPRPGPSP